MKKLYTKKNRATPGTENRAESQPARVLEFEESMDGLYTGSELARVKNFLLNELKRSHTTLKKKKPGVYYLAYLFRNSRMEGIQGRLGAITHFRKKTKNSAFCDLRVGSYRYDNVQSGGLIPRSSETEEGEDLSLMPQEVHEDAYRHSLWRLTEARYREAAEEYYNKKSRELHYVDLNRDLPAMLKRKPIHHWNYSPMIQIDMDHWANILRKAGDVTRNHSDIKNSFFDFFIHYRQTLMVNSEGSVILQQSQIFELRGYFWLLTANGEGISQEISFITGSHLDLPGEQEFLRKVKEKIQLLQKMEKAPIINAFSGPVLLDPKPAGLFFHEVVGHRLEGSRLLSLEEGSTFRDLKGKRLTPDFIDIIDDPTLDSFGKQATLGFFDYDDEGSKSKSTLLVEKGILKRFLSTASPLPSQRELNGHARNQLSERPISRMGNLIVKNRKPVSRDKLKEMFLQEIRKSGKPFGIHIIETLGGETETSSYDFQAFKGEILHATRVFPDGREELVRGVDFVGTPLSALDSVVVMGDDATLDNSFCGAESGIIPVSSISPSLLMKNLELQTNDRERYAPFAYPSPIS